MGLAAFAFQMDEEVNFNFNLYKSEEVPLYKSAEVNLYKSAEVNLYKSMEVNLYKSEENFNLNIIQSRFPSNIT